MINRSLPPKVEQHVPWQRQEQQQHEKHHSEQAPPKSRNNKEYESSRSDNIRPLAARQLPSVSVKTPLRQADKQRLTRDENEFNRLLNDDPITVSLLPVALPGPVDPDGLLGKTEGSQQSTSSSLATVMWQIVEPPLSQDLATQEAFPAHFSLLLPQLGEINVQVTALPTGDMNVALGFSARAYEIVRGSEKQCAESLAKRMGQRVRLRFQRQDTLL